MNSSPLPLVAFISTGGTMASIGADGLDLVNYAATDTRLEADQIVARIPELSRVARVLPVRFRAVPSTRIQFEDWKDLVELCGKLEKQHEELAGIVIGHGTSSLEETAYFLNLTLKVSIPVVVTGSQRPLNALSSDAPLNLLNAVRVAGHSAARGKGVLVVLNDEIHAAREVTKSDTLRLHSFIAPGLGPLGFVDGDRVSFYRASLRRHYPDTDFDLTLCLKLPNVAIIHAHIGSDGAIAEELLRNGVAGIVSAGFAPGHPGQAEAAVFREAVEKGVAIVQSRRGFSGRVPWNDRLLAENCISADNLSPEKARLLLALAIQENRGPDFLTSVFDEY